MSEIYFIPYPCRPWADPYHDGHAYIHTYIPLKESPFQVIDEIRVHCAPTEDPEIWYSVEVKPMEYEIELLSEMP